MINIYNQCKCRESYLNRIRDFLRHIDSDIEVYDANQKRLKRDYLGLLHYYSPYDVAILYCKDIVRLERGLDLDSPAGAYEYYIREVYGYEEDWQRYY